MKDITVSTDPGAGEPVYRQVARQIREMIAYGELPAGRRLPSVRALASDLGVNLNTVARAYRVLEKEGFVAIKGRSRVEVAPPAGAPPAGAPPDKELSAQAHLMESLREVLARLRQSGVGVENLRRIVIDEVESMRSGWGRVDRGSRCRRPTRR